ncbi:MAG: DUF992 domain-containing protein [Pseudomonadota bacterium]
MTSNRLAAAVAAAVLATAAAPALAQSTQAKVESGEQGRIESGILKCAMTDRSNFVLVSTTTFSCEFDRSGDNEMYVGEITSIGLDLQIKNATELRWAVVAPRNIDAEAGALAGGYGGAAASVALGYGAGAKVLVGGLDESIALQPLSVSGERGVGAALGVEGLRLELAN